MSGYTYETELNLDPDLSGVEDPVTVVLEMELTCTQHGEAPSGMFGPPEYYDPGCGPEFDLDEVRILLGEGKDGKPIGDIVLKAKQFDALFGTVAERLFESACDAASETGEFG